MVFGIGGFYSCFITQIESKKSIVI
ncbi:hypothetical protein ACFSQW_16855 [Sphingobacterium tabacisoli]|uniref:Uncharacterized protein n=1 Tax=Sphingobacterium tabacisoli TaxID=2044855 RepID=A0ABW5L6E4_9SPHI